MSGTKAGGLKAAATNIEKHGVVEEESETPEHATAKRISVWQKIFRHGKTTICEDEDA